MAFVVAQGSALHYRIGDGRGEACRSESRPGASAERGTISIPEIYGGGASRWIRTRLQLVVASAGASRSQRRFYDFKFKLKNFTAYQNATPAERQALDGKRRQAGWAGMRKKRLFAFCSCRCFGSAFRFVSVGGLTADIILVGDFAFALAWMSFDHLLIVRDSAITWDWTNR